MLGAAFGGGVVVGIAVAGDDSGAPRDAEGITETEHDRLLDACMASTPEPASCPEYVTNIVGGAEDAGCGYTEAAELMAWHFDNPDSRRHARTKASERILDCE